MVNVIIYIKKEFDAEELVKNLLSEKLIASASVDENNVSYSMNSNGFHKNTYSVITAKSKSLLLPYIIKSVEEKIDSEVLINATPIVGSNKFFDALVRENTKPI